MKQIEGFEPLLCFARNSHQTIDEVFDMVQERMMTILGKAYLDNGVGICYFTSQASKEEIAAILDWQATSILMTPGDFERMGYEFGLSMSKALGKPRIPETLRVSISRKFKLRKNGNIDPVVALVTFAAFDQIEEMVKERKAMAETHKEVV